MARNRETALAWHLLVHDKRRLLLSVAGVSFAVFLMFIEMGFLNGVYDSQTLLLRRLDADLVMLSTLKDALHPTKPFPRRRLIQARQFEEVADVSPVYMNEYSTWKYVNDRVSPISVVAFPLEKNVLQIPELPGFREILQQPDTVVADSRSRSFLGALRVGEPAELNGQQVRIVGTFSLGPDFRVDGRLLMSDRNFVTCFPDRKTGLPNLEQIELGLIVLKSGVDVDATRDRIQQALPSDVRVVTKADLIAEEVRFWASNQPIGLIFGLGMIVGFVIGVSICYQILFTDVNDHQAEFATLKAMGYPNRYLIKVVLQEGCYLSLLAFLPGLLASFALYSNLQAMTGISMELTPLRVIVVFALTVSMCLISAALAIRRVLNSDPAEVF